MVFLDAVERRYVDELGGMNIFFVYDDGTPGHPAADRHDPAGHHPGRGASPWPGEPGRTVGERPVSFDEWQADAASGRLREVFACGTAAVITPIGRVRHPDGEFTVADGSPGEVTTGLRQTLVDIQRGRIEDVNGWVYRIP